MPTPNASTPINLADPAKLHADWLAWLDHLLAIALQLQQEGYDAPAFATPDELSPERTIELPSARAVLREELGQILQRMLQNVESGNTRDPLAALFTAFEMSHLDQLACIMALAFLEHQKYGMCYGRLLGLKRAAPPTILLVTSLYRLYADPTATEENVLQNPFSPLRRMVFNYNNNDTLHLRNRVLLWVHGHSQLSGALDKICHVCAPSTSPLLIHQSEYENLQQCANGGNPVVIQLCGRWGCGRKFLLSHRVATQQCAILSLDCTAVLALSTMEQELFLDQLALEVRLTGSELHLFAIPTDEAQLPIVTALCKTLQAISPVLFLSVEQSILFSVPTFVLALDHLNITERQRIWQAQTVPFSPEIDLVQCATQYRITPGRIVQVCKEARIAAQSAGHDQILLEDFLPVVHRGSTSQLEQLAKRVPLAYQWDDLMLPPDQKDILRLANDRLRLRHQVDEVWGMERKIAYGRGLSMLFFGSPGTGKTMAAQILAQEAEKELFAVDLSQLNSKYIGELEKNIAKIFEAARDSNAILFFDEADSLFAKRTEVQSSNDRYANSGVSFLLQQMEQYEGMCILATNLFQNFDAAFVRRITFVVRFQNPTQAERLAMWQALFNGTAPLDEAVCLEKFAQHVELSGSGIKAIAYNATFLAAREQSPIKTDHLLQALRLEYTKTGKIVPPESLLRMP